MVSQVSFYFYLFIFGCPPLMWSSLARDQIQAELWTKLDLLQRWVLNPQPSAPKSLSILLCHRGSSTSLFFFFFFLVIFFRATPVAYGGSLARGSNWSLSCWPRPQPQHQVWAASVTYTTDHGNLGSLTHWVMPGSEHPTSWFLVRFASAVPWQELLFFFGYIFETTYYQKGEYFLVSILEVRWGWGELKWHKKTCGFGSVESVQKLYETMYLQKCFKSVITLSFLEAQLCSGLSKTTLRFYGRTHRTQGSS